MEGMKAIVPAIGVASRNVYSYKGAFSTDFAEGPESEIGGRSRPHRACPPHQTAYHCAVRREQRKRGIEPGRNSFLEML